MGVEQRNSIKALRGAWVTVSVGLIVAALWSGFGLVVPANRLASSIAPQVVEGVPFSQLPHLTYKGVDFAVVEARAVPPDDVRRAPLVVVELAAYNRTDNTLRLRGEAFGLEVASSQLGQPGLPRTSVALDRFEYSADQRSIVVESGEMVQAAAVFKLRSVETPSVDDLVLRLAEPGKQAALLSLGDLGISSPQDSELRITQFDKNTENQLLSGEILAEDGYYRASSGNYLLRVKILVASNSPAVSSPKDWVLSYSNGEDNLVEATPIKVETVPNAKTTMVVDLLFSYPEAATNFNIVSMRDGGVGGLEIIDSEKVNES